jgi:hypothetical protein
MAQGASVTAVNPSLACLLPAEVGALGGEGLVPVRYFGATHEDSFPPVLYGMLTARRAGSVHFGLEPMGGHCFKWLQ